MSRVYFILSESQLFDYIKKNLEKEINGYDRFTRSTLPDGV